MNYSWKLDKFDSEVLGFKVAKILDIKSNGSGKILEDRLRSLLTELNKNKVRYASYRIRANDFPVIHALESAGFILVDGLISLSIDTFSAMPEVAPEIREARKSDLLKLKKLTSGLYSTTRITNDPLISKERANKYYMKWIENSVKGSAADSVLVWEEKGKILGYVTLQKKGQIPLIGVSEKARGRGIGKELIYAALATFKSWGLENVKIETQVANIPALRVYQACGFKIISSHLTFRWIKK